MEKSELLKLLKNVENHSDIEDKESAVIRLLFCYIDDKEIVEAASYLFIDY